METIPKIPREGLTDRGTATVQNTVTVPLGGTVLRTNMPVLQKG